MFQIQNIKSHGEYPTHRAWTLQRCVIFGLQYLHKAKLLSLLIFTIGKSFYSWNHTLWHSLTTKSLTFFAGPKWMWHWWHLLLCPHRGKKGLRSWERLGVKHCQTSPVTYPASNNVGHFASEETDSQLQVDLRLWLRLLKCSEGDDEQNAESDGLAGAGFQIQFLMSFQ